MLIVIYIFIACMLILTGILLALSPGKPRPFVGENGKPLPNGISEKTFVNINGAEQGMFIKSKDVTKPVLLFGQAIERNGMGGFNSNFNEEM